MDLKKIISMKGFIFLVIFTALVFVGDNIKVFKLVNSKDQYFTLFQFFGPIAGSFLGPVVGVLAVLIAEVANFFVAGKSWELLTILRLLPMLFAAYYFGTIGKKGLRSKIVQTVVPALAIVLFILHPVGRHAWFFALYWTIPIIIVMLDRKYSDRVFLRSLGATFTAHSIGGIIWIYLQNTTPEFWIGLIPIVAYERLLFATGISLSFIGMNILLDRLGEKMTTGFVAVNKEYVANALFGSKAKSSN